MAGIYEKLSPWEPLIQEKARQYGVPIELVRSVIYQESRGNPKAVSPVGASGLMQLMPGTAKDLGVSDPFDPVQNVDGGVRYLKQMISKYGLVGGVAAYNAGPGNVEKYGGIPPFKETQGYVQNVLGRMGPWDSMSGGMQGPMPAPTPEKALVDQVRQPFEQLRKSLGIKDQPAVKTDPMGNQVGNEPWYMKPSEVMKSMAQDPMAQDVYGVGRTVFKGANQAAAKMMDTGAQALRDFSPFGLPAAAQEFGQMVGLPQRPDSPEARLADWSRKVNPFGYLQRMTGRMNQAAQAEAPTNFEKKYDQPIWQTEKGTTIIPSPGELARSTGTYAPEMLLAASMPARGLGQAVTQRFGIQTPSIAKTTQTAVQQGFGGLAGGTAKGEPGEAALNTALFPLMTFAGAGVGHYVKDFPARLQRWDMQDQTGAVRPFAKKLPDPVPETAETIALQLDALKGGRSNAVLVTPGSPMPKVPREFQSIKTEVGTWIYDPKKVKGFEIRRDVVTGDFGKHLGHLEPKGPGTSQVVSATQGGIEAKTSLASPEAAEAQAQILQAQFPQAKIAVDGPEAAIGTIQQRLRQVPPPAGAGGAPPTQPPPGRLMRERGFTTTVRESPITAPEVAKGVSGEYGVISNEEAKQAAHGLIQQDINQARNVFLETRQPTKHSQTLGMELVKEYSRLGNWDEAIRIANQVSEKATNPAQATQALAAYENMGPEGILRFAQKTVRAAREDLPKGKAFRFEKQVKEAVKQAEASGQPVDAEMIREMIAKKLKIPTVTPEFAERITQKAAAIQAMPDGYEKSFATAKMLRDIGELVPPSTLRKISSFQTIAQLFNPKTIMRNLAGNAAFTAGENLKDVIAAPLDRAVSLFTSQRTKSLAGGNQYKEQLKGFMQGLYEGAREAWHGIDTTKIADKFEINNLKQGFLQGRTFRGKIMGTIERTLGVALRAPDRAFYKAAVNKSLAEQMSIAGGISPTDEMIAQAHFEGLYKTFQDESVAARIFTGLKRSLNLGKEFGVGDILIKYPKTPGNILARSIEYSPAGFVKSLMEVGKAAMGQGFDQKAFVDSTSRAIVGTGGLTALGYGLSNIGILRNTAPRDPELRAVEATEGRTQSQLNVSGLRRYLMSGFDKKAAEWRPEDTLATYDWAVPLSTSLSLGARAQEKGLEQSMKLGDQMDNLALAAAGFEGALDTLGEQPMIRTLTSLARGNTMAKSLMNIAKGVPASFTPTMLKQFEQLTDNTRRDTYDPNPAVQAFNMVLGKTPFADSLPEQVDPFGKPKENYQGNTNSILNVMFNPSFFAKYRPTPESKMVVDLYRSTSDARIAPIVVENKFKWNGIPYEMDAKQRSVMQKWVGERTKQFFGAMAANPGFQQMPDEGKVKVLTEYLTKLRAAGRASIFLYEMNQRPLLQRPAFMAQIIQKHKLSPEQVKGVFRDMAVFQALNK